MKILDGKKVRDILAGKITLEFKKFKAKPQLVIIQVGENSASSVYIQQKISFGEKLRCIVSHIQFSKKISEKAIIAKIKKLNTDKKVTGIILQLPLPFGMNVATIIESIAPDKDVDGMHSKNIAELLGGSQSGFIPATTKGIISLLDFYKIPIEGKKVVIVGKSVLVGRPTALAFLNRNATVTICHSKTKNLKAEVKQADIVVVAVGKPKFITKSFVRKGQIVIDVGITRVGGNIFGDVDFKPVSAIVSAITPVPGGVGPMTVVSLFENLLMAYKRQQKNML